MSASMTLPRTLCDADKAHGRVQIINGDVFYSPNCSKELKSIPEPDYHNILRPIPPYEKIRHPTNFSAVTFTDYQHPRWWSVPFGWVAFIPRIPDFSGPVLGRMNRLPYRDELEFEEGKGYSMPSRMLQDWRSLERDIVHAVELLAVHTKSSPLLPAFPTVFGYRHQHKSWRTALIAFERSRSWFVMWIGVLSYLIAVADTETAAKKNYPLIALADWYSHLVNTGCSETWLEGLTASSMVCDFNIWAEKAGTFVSLEDLQKDIRLPRVEWLCAFGIPNWYRWKPEWLKNPKFEAYAPLPHQLQCVFNDIPAHVSQQVEIFQALQPSLSSNHALQKKNMTWTEFKASRDAINAQRERVESVQHRNERMNRANNPVTSSAKVFKWIPDDDGNLVRTKVHMTLNLATLEGYEKRHVHYDAFWHEWDCCTEIGPGGSYDNESDYGENEGFDDLDFTVNTSFPDFEIFSEANPGSTERKSDWAHRQNLGDQSAGNNDSSLFTDGLARNDSDEKTDRLIENLEVEIFRVLRLHFGFTGTLPPASSSPVENSTERTRFMRVIGTKLGNPDAANPLFERENIMAACNFIHRLQSNAKILDDEWDLGRTHRETIYLNRRMSCIRLLNVNLSTTDFPKPVTWYMFDFGSARTKSWMFTVMSAGVALTVCRLDNSYTDADLATYFLQTGMAFRTMQNSSSLTRASYSTKSTSKKASRMQGYQFLIDDFATFEARATTFLTENQRARVACMMGGIMWRVACSVVNWEMVLNGPSGWSLNRSELVVGIQEGTSTEFIDDALTPDEISDLCGMYYVLTGKGYQYENPSWYPTPDSFAGSGFDYGYWSDFCESQFKNWRLKGSEPKSSAQPHLPKRPPINKVHWTSNLKGSAELRRARSRIEKLAVDIIRGFCV